MTSDLPLVLFVLAFTGLAASVAGDCLRELTGERPETDWWKGEG